MLRNLENVLVNGVMTYKDPVAFRFFENVEIPFRDAGEYKVCVHTKEVDNALKIFIIIWAINILNYYQISIIYMVNLK